MTKSSRKGLPGVLDADRGESHPERKRASVIDVREAAAREDTRAGLRDLDQMLERAGGLTRAQRDRDRLFPRNATAEIGHPRMVRRFPVDGGARRPVSGWQMRQRSKTKRATLQRLPRTQLHALDEITSSRETWTRINNALSDETSDIDAMTEEDRTTAKRVDRAIQAYERGNTRGHVLYANVEMPAYVNHTSLASFVQASFQPGDEVAFDRYTGSTHQLHEVSAIHDPAGRVACFELKTRRGIYLGQSEGGAKTGHLLPRGMQWRVTGTTTAHYVDPAGRTGTRIVIQMEDITPEPGKDTP